MYAFKIKQNILLDFDENVENPMYISADDVLAYEPSESQGKAVIVLPINLVSHFYSIINVLIKYIINTLHTCFKIDPVLLLCFVEENVRILRKC